MLNKCNSAQSRCLPQLLVACSDKEPEVISTLPKNEAVEREVSSLPKDRVELGLLDREQRSKH